MKRKLAVLIVCALLPLAACQKERSSKDRENDRAAVLKVYEQMKQAWAKGDIALADSAFRPDTIFIDAQNTGEVQHWASARASVQQTFQAVHEIKLTDAGQPVVDLDGDAAWLASKYHISATGPQGPVEATGMLTLTLLRRQGAYHIVAFHSSRLP